MALKKPTRKIFWLTSSHFIQNCILDVAQKLRKKYNLNIPKLSQEGKISCEGKLTVKECWNVLDSMGNNRSPENDGFTKEFYSAFFNDLNRYLVDSLNFSLENGEFSSSQKQDVITLSEKKDRDKRILKNWRPNDIKIASKALALRVRNVIHELIHSIKMLS